MWRLDEYEKGNPRDISALIDDLNEAMDSVEAIEKLVEEHI